mgnify:CR=1 FL=1
MKQGFVYTGANTAEISFPLGGIGADHDLVRRYWPARARRPVRLDGYSGDSVRQLRRYASILATTSLWAAATSFQEHRPVAITSDFPAPAPMAWARDSNFSASFSSPDRLEISFASVAERRPVVFSSCINSSSHLTRWFGLFGAPL